MAVNRACVVILEFFKTSLVRQSNGLMEIRILPRSVIDCPLTLRCLCSNNLQAKICQLTWEGPSAIVTQCPHHNDFSLHGKSSLLQSLLIQRHEGQVHDNPEVH